MRRLVTVLGLVLVLTLTVTPVFAFPVPGNGNTDVVVMNMGNSSTDATAIYFSASGVAEWSANQPLNGYGSHRFGASSAAVLGDNWRGSMVVQSAGEVAAVAELVWTNGSAQGGTTGDAYTGFAAGSTVMYVPYAVYAVNSQYSVFSVQNTEGTSNQIRMTFRNRNGGQDLTLTETLPGSGSKSYDMRDFAQLQSSAFWNANCAAGLCFWSGAIKIESLDAKPIVVAVTNHNTQYAEAYSAVPSGATTSYVASVERRCVDCAWNPPGGQFGDWVGFSIVTVQCLSDVPCQMTMQFVGQTASMTNLTLPTRTLNPGQAVAASTRAGNDYNQSLFTGLVNNADPVFPNTWAGSVIVNTTNGTQVAVVSFNIRPRENISTATAGASIVDSGRNSFLPLVYKIGTCEANVGLNWQRFSIFRIQNPNTVNANDVDIYYYNRNGSLAHQELNRTIAAGTALTRHTRADCQTLAPLGNNWEGSVRIVSDQPLVVTSESYVNAFMIPAYGPTWAAGYNAYSVSP